MENFVASFSPSLTEHYLVTAGAEGMIVTDNIPSLNIACGAFGVEPVKIIIRQHLLKLAIAFGVQTTNEQIEEITSVVLDMAKDLKVTEIMLFFHLMKQNKFLDRHGEDSSKMFGSLNIQAISESLTNYRNNYRRIAIENVEKEERKKREEEIEKNAATDDERRQIILDALDKNPNNTILRNLAKANGWI